MRVELISLLTEVSADKSIRVLVLTGVGKAFCADGDITTMEGVKAPLEGTALNIFSNSSDGCKGKNMGR
jgi:enoyl-CoA hydratase/carnithine racemase